MDYRKEHLSTGPALLLAAALLIGSAAAAQDKDKKTSEPEAKEVGGMSIVGNNETPKSLIIVPWKSSEIGQETEFQSSQLYQDTAPVDPASFRRELEFYKLSNPN